MGLRGVLRAWLDHRGEVLIRRSRHRLGAVERRLELLDGFLTVFLDLDEVIRIIREEDDAKAGLIRSLRHQRWAGGGDPEHAAALAAPAGGDGAASREHAALEKEKKRGLNALLGSENLRWKRVAEEIAATRKQFGTGPARRPADGAGRDAGGGGRVLRAGGGARAADGGAVGERLDPGGARPRGRGQGAEVQGGRRPAPHPALPIHRPACACSPPTAAPTPCAPPSCPAAAATGSRSACWPR